MIAKHTVIIAALGLLGGYLVAQQNPLVIEENKRNNITEPEGNGFSPLKQSDLLRAKAMLRWLIDNRTESGVHTFNAGFIRLAFHDCVGGCDGCINLANRANNGLDFYKFPLDRMYTEYWAPYMSRSDWYALAGIVGVEYAAELTPCNGEGCVPKMPFRWGRKSCRNEIGIFRFFPAATGDGRAFLRRSFRMTLQEVTALMGAHTLGRDHANAQSWVGKETIFDNGYYKALLDPHHNWTIGLRNGTLRRTFSHDTGKHLMFIDDMFLAYDMRRPLECSPNPVQTCNKSSSYESVLTFSKDNKLWLKKFGDAFTIMITNGNFGKLKKVVMDTDATKHTGDIFIEGPFTPPPGQTVPIFTAAKTGPPTRQTTTTTTTQATTTTTETTSEESPLKLAPISLNNLKTNISNNKHKAIFESLKKLRSRLLSRGFLAPTNFI